MHRLTGSEFKCLMYICRRTFGFHKKKDRIAFSQFTDGITDESGERLDGGTGLSRPQVSESLSNLLSFGLINKKEDTKGNFYEINLNCDLLEVVKKVNQFRIISQKSGKESLPQVVKKVNQSGKESLHTKESKKEREIKNINPKGFAVWDFKKYKESMYSDNRKGLQIIALFFDEKGLTFDSQEECQMAIKEHLRIANELVKIDKDKIFKAMDYAKREYPDMWKLTTVAKVISSRKI